MTSTEERTIQRLLRCDRDKREAVSDRSAGLLLAMLAGGGHPAAPDTRRLPSPETSHEAYTGSEAQQLALETQRRRVQMSRLLEEAVMAFSRQTTASSDVPREEVTPVRVIPVTTQRRVILRRKPAAGE